MDDIMPSATTQTSNQTPLPKNQEQSRLRLSSSVVKVSVFAGVFLLSLLEGVPWVWGNLTVYVTSYYYVRGDDSSISTTDWIISISSIGFNFGLLLGGLIAGRIGIRLTLFFFFLGFNGGLIFSYFTLQHSAIALCATIGAVTGICGGIVENCQLTVVVRWTDRYKGLAASSVPSMNILGAVGVNFILTMFINPSNYKTNDIRDDISIFTQPDLISRVAYSFLVYGFLSLALNTIGFVLVRVNREDDNIVYELTNKFKNFVNSKQRKEETVHYDRDYSATRYVSLRDDENVQKKTTPRDDETEATPIVPKNKDTNYKNNQNEASLHLTPKQALKTKAFYVLCIFASILNYGYFTLNTYYKAFGLLYIPDDHFLTAVVMVKCLFSPICTWIAGFCVDKLGVKPTMVSISSMFCVVASLYYLTAVNRWLYLLTTVLYGCALFSLYCLTSACCVKLYGQTHFSTIFGLVQSFSNAITLAAPPFTGWVLATHGWGFLFGSVGVLAFCQAVLLVLALPRKQLF